MKSELVKLPERYPEWRDELSTQVIRHGLDHLPLNKLIERAGIKIEDHLDDKGHKMKRLTKDGKELADIRTGSINAYELGQYIAMREMGVVE